MPITPLPPAPQRQDEPDFITQKADAMFSALPNFVTEANALETNVNAKEVSVNAAAVTATTQAELATTARIAAESARDEAVGAVATLPDGIVNDAIISTTDTWSSDKISKLGGFKIEYKDISVLKQGNRYFTKCGLYNMGSWYCSVHIEVISSVYTLFVTPITFDSNDVPVYGTPAQLSLSANSHISIGKSFGEKLVLGLLESTTNAVHLVACTHSNGVVAIGAKQTLHASGATSSSFGFGYNTDSTGVLLTTFTSSRPHITAFSLSGTVFTFGAPFQLTTLTGNFSLPSKVDSNKFLVCGGDNAYLVTISGLTVSLTQTLPFTGLTLASTNVSLHKDGNKYIFIRPDTYYFSAYTIIYNSGVLESDISQNGFLSNSILDASPQPLTHEIAILADGVSLRKAGNNQSFYILKKESDFIYSLDSNSIKIQKNIVSGAYGDGNSIYKNGYLYLLSTYANGSINMLAVARHEVNI